jgi:outer membrane protein assembly factor BamA
MNRFAALILILTLISPWLAQARELVYSGVSKSHISRIEKTFSLREGQVIRVRQAGQVSKFLMKTKYYESVNVFRLKNGKLQIEAVPVREISSIVMRGNSRYSRSKLIEISELKEGQKFVQRSAVEGGEKIKAYYGRSGFFNAVIEIDIKALDSRKMSVIYRVKEGAACKIKSIEFTSKNLALNKKTL